MSVANQLNKMIDNLQNSYAALSNKGAVIPQNKNIQNLKSTIDTMSGGILRFNNLTERDAYEGTLSEGDICIVYSEPHEVNSTDEYNSFCTFPTGEIPRTLTINTNILNPEIYDIEAINNGQTPLGQITLGFIGEIVQDEDNPKTGLVIDIIEATSKSRRIVSPSTYELSIDIISISLEEYNPVTGEYPQYKSLTCYWNDEVEDWTIYLRKYDPVQEDWVEEVMENSFMILYLTMGSASFYHRSSGEWSSGSRFSEWTDELKKLIGVSGNLTGFYKYHNNQWELITDGLNVNKNRVLGTCFYGPNGIEYGTLNSNRQVPTDELQFKSLLWSSLKNLNTDYITDFSRFYAKNTSIRVADDVVLNTTYGVKMVQMFDGACYIQNVYNYDTSNVTNMASMFRYCYSLNEIPNFNTSNVTNMSSMFYYCNNLTTVPNFDTINVTDMSSIFGGCSRLNEIPNFNTSNVTNMFYMFTWHDNLTAVPDFDTSNVTDMCGMFQHCNHLTTVPNFNTGNVINMEGMFEQCRNLTTVPNFNTSNAKDMSSMFHQCYNLTSVPKFDTSNVTDIAGMFEYCYNLTAVPNFDISNVIDMSHTFSTCSNLTTIPNMNTSNVTHMSYTFHECVNLTIVPNFNTSNVTNMYWMFYNCYDLTTVPNYNTSNVTNMAGTFWGCNSLTAVPNFDISNAINTCYMFYNCTSVFNIPEYINAQNSLDASRMFYLCNNYTGSINININNVRNAQEMFYNCRNLSNVYCYAESGNLSNCHEMFMECHNIPSVPNMNTSNVTIMSRMFAYCSNLTTVPNYNTSNVTDMFEMFTYCSNLTTVPNMNTSNVMNMARMFTSCSNLASVPNMNTSRATSMGGMFYNCPNLTTVPNFATSNVTNMWAMFGNCSNLTTVPNFDATNVTSVDNMFTGCSNLSSLTGLYNLGAAYDSSVNSEKGDINLSDSSLLTEASITNLFTSVANVSTPYNIYLSPNCFSNINTIAAYDLLDKGWMLPNYVLAIGFDYTYTNSTSGRYIATSDINAQQLKQQINNYNGNNNLSEISIKSYGNIINIDSLFSNLGNLISLNLGDCSNITSIANLIYGSTKIETLLSKNLGSGFSDTTSVSDRTLNLTTCNNISNTSFVNLFNDLGRVSVESHINISTDNLQKLTDSEKRIPCKKGWTLDGYEYIPEGWEALEALGVINLNATGATYGFEKDNDDEGDYYKNQNQNKDSTTATMQINITSDVINLIGDNLVLNCYYSSESVSFDYLQINKNGSQYGSRYGDHDGNNWYNTQISIPIIVNDQIQIIYRKDGSVSGGQDGVKIYLSE